MTPPSPHRNGLLTLWPCLVLAWLPPAAWSHGGEAHHEGSRPDLLDKVSCGPWSVVGPFKEGLFENILGTFNAVYPPEAQVLAAGRGEVDSGTSWEVPALPGMTETGRRWVSHPEWTDGYRHLLPRGPAPSRSETVYLSRRIDAGGDLDLHLHLYAEDFIRVWLNGKLLGEAERGHGPSRFPTALLTDLPLKAGANRLLVKISSLHAAHGFAFSIPELHPHHDLRPGQQSSRIMREGGKAEWLVGFRRPMCGPADEAPRNESAREVAEEFSARWSFPAVA